MKRFILSSIIILSAFLSRAQESTCGTELTAEHYQNLVELVGNAQRITAMRSGAIKIPVKVHIVQNADGYSGLSMDDIIFEFDKLNDLFSGADMEFYLSSEIDYIKDEELYDFNQSEEAKLAASRDEPNAMNIYFVGSITNKQGNEICGYTYYPEARRDRIFVAAGCLQNSSTLAHEIGHYFSLIHSHGISGVDPEAVNGENCEEAGDLICDTPADPNLLGKVDGDCNYSGHERDFNGDAYDPDTRNIMSYAPSYCRSEFSMDQLKVMTASYLANKSYLVANDDYSPIADFVSNNNFNDEVSNKLQIRVYANPGADQLGVEILDGLEGEFQVQVFNIMGNLIYEEHMDTYNQGNKKILDLSANVGGVYFVNVVGKGRHASEKVMLM